MGSNKNISNNARNILLIILFFFGGMIIGLILNDIPFFRIKKEVDLGIIIAILGLFGSYFYIPYVVDRKFSKLDSINEVIRKDIESILSEVEQLKNIYINIKPTVAIKEEQYTEILAHFKNISADLLSLNKELVDRNRLKNFKDDVYDKQFANTREVCTENLQISKRFPATECRESKTQLNKLVAVLKKYRYETYTDS